MCITASCGRHEPGKRSGTLQATVGPTDQAAHDFNTPGAPELVGLWLAGVAVMIGRVGTGFMLDRLVAPRLAAFFLGVGAVIGAAAGSSTGFLGASRGITALVGLAIGAPSGAAVGATIPAYVTLYRAAPAAAAP
jgi:hypothetical protein